MQQPALQFNISFVCSMSLSQYSDCDDDDDYDDYDSYYQEDMDTTADDVSNNNETADPEHFSFTTLSPVDVERLLNEDVAKLQSVLHVGIEHSAVIIGLICVYAA